MRKCGHNRYFDWVTARKSLRTTGLTDTQLVGVTFIHSAKKCAVLKLCRVHKTNKNFAKVHISPKQATETH